MERDLEIEMEAESRLNHIQLKEDVDVTAA